MDCNLSTMLKVVHENFIPKMSNEESKRVYDKTSSNIRPIDELFEISNNGGVSNIFEDSIPIAPRSLVLP